MLQRFMNLGVYLYTIAGMGVVGLLVMCLINGVSKKAIKDKTTYTRVVGKLRVATVVSSVLCLAMTSAAMGVAFSVDELSTTGIRHLAVGLGAVFLLICYGKYLAFSDRERVLSDYLFRMMEQQKEEEPEVEVVVPPTKEELVERALKGIHQSAATGENKFSHLLSQEEQAVMREVIQEFIGEG